MRKFLMVTAWVFGFLVVSLALIVAHANYRIGTDEVLAKEANAPGRFFTVQNHQVHTQTIGDIAAPGATPLLLIHGFVLSGHTAFLPWARETLAPNRALILPDLLGYGFSERIPFAGEHYELKSYSRDLAALLDQLGVQRVDVAGHSWGGIIAAQFARDYPDRVRRLVLMDAAFYFPKSSPLEGIIKLPLGVGRAVTWHALAGGPMSFVGLICHGQSTCEGAPTTQIKDSTETIQAMLQTSRQSDDISDMEANIASVTTPTLVLWGALDQFVPLATGERLSNELPSARIAVIEDAWHMPWLEQPKETARLIEEFLDGAAKLPAAAGNSHSRLGDAG